MRSDVSQVFQFNFHRSLISTGSIDDQVSVVVTLISKLHAVSSSQPQSGRN